MILKAFACSVVLTVGLWIAADTEASEGAPRPTRTPLRVAVDLNVGEAQDVVLSDGTKVTVKLLDLTERRDTVRSAVRSARVKIDVGGRAIALTSATYHLPSSTSGVQVDCPITRGYLDNTNRDHWGLEKDARLRLWPAGSPLLRPGSFLYPVKQRWFASLTWMANEPVDGGSRISRKIYYHSGLDIGGAEGLVEVVAATDGLVVSRGTQVLSGDHDSPVEKRYDVVYLLDDRGWYYRYSHLQRIDPGVRLGERLKMGQRVGILGKEGASGG